MLVAGWGSSWGHDDLVARELDPDGGAIRDGIGEQGSADAGLDSRAMNRRNGRAP
ncbi:MAG: hypothetical protein M3460_13715 [Actinomycetota bacterium]|nr:hypothetical protein [Actinomycetota bacterium]